MTWAWFFIMLTVFLCGVGLTLWYVVQILKRPIDNMKRLTGEADDGAD